MALGSVLQIAVSALSTNQSALRTTSTNLANVNTPGYVRQVAILGTQVVGTTGAGVEVAEIRRLVDEFLSTELRKSISDAERFDVLADLHGRIQALLGRPDDDTNLIGQLNRVFTSLADVTTDPSAPARRSAVINDLEAFGDEISLLARQIQDLRAETDRQIVNDIEIVNDALARIHELNLLITRETLAGRDPIALIEQRAQTANSVAEIIDLRIADLGNGAIGLSTISGVTLIDNVPRKLVYNGVGTVTSSTRFSQISVNKVDPVTGTVDSVGVALDPGVTSGRLRGYLDMRNVQLPDFAAQLGELAAKVIDELNRIHNDNSAVPAPNSLTGRNTGLLLGDNHGFTGNVTFAVLNSNSEISSQYTLDFSTVTTISDVIADVNANLVGGSLSLVGGVLTFSAAVGTDGVAIKQPATAASDRGGRGFAHFFGMNDLMEAKVPVNFDTGFVGTDTHNFSGTATFEFRSPDGQVAVSHTVDFGAIGANFNAIVTDLNTNMGSVVSFSLDSNGALVVTPNAAFSSYKLFTVSDASSRSGAGVTLSQLFGIGERYQADAALDAGVKAVVKSDPNLLALAKLDTAAGAGAPALTVGDNRGGTELQNIVSSSFSFRAAGELAATTLTLSEYAGLVVSQVSINAENASRLLDDRSALRAGLQERVDAVSGVNLDEELANMLIFQNAFNASARVMATADEMLDILFSLTQ